MKAIRSSLMLPGPTCACGGLWTPTVRFCLFALCFSASPSRENRIFRSNIFFGTARFLPTAEITVVNSRMISPFSDEVPLISSVSSSQICGDTDAKICTNIRTLNILFIFRPSCPYWWNFFPPILCIASGSEGVSTKFPLTA
jgi:hypothetical protein